MISVQGSRPRRKQRIRQAVAGLCAAAALSTLPTAQGQSSSPQPPPHSPASGWSSVIATVNGALTPSRTLQLRALHADITRRLPLIHAVALRVPRRSLTALTALPFLTHLSPDTPVRRCDEFTVSSSEDDVALQKYGLTGRGVTVAVIDSGVQNVPDLKRRVVASVSVIANDPSTADACGHGTHVAGIIAGDGFSSTGRRYFQTFYGIARQAQIASVRVLDSQGQSDVSTVLAGLQWAIDNKARYNIRVINLSLGHPVGESYTTDPLCQGVEAAWKAGIVVVCAAGNSGRLQNATDPSADNEGYGTAYGSIESPGNDPDVITVGATKSADGRRADDRIATYSSRGPSRLDFVLKPDIVAPGNQVVSTLAKNSYLDTAYADTNQIPLSLYSYTKNEDKSSNRYFRLSGTSMAAPVVAGAAVLLLQQDPTLSPDTIKLRLMASADKWSSGAAGDSCTYGAGYLDIPNALASTLVATRPAVSPTLLRDSAGNVSIDTSTLLGGDDSLWGSGVKDLRFLWGNSALVGDTSSLTASRFLWGNSVWSDRFLWGNSSSAADLSATALNGEE